MKIIIRNADKVAIHAEAALTLSANGVHGHGWIDPNLTTANATIADADLPAGWVGGVWSYNGEWAIHDAAALAAFEQAAAEKAAEALHAKREAMVVSPLQGCGALLQAGFLDDVNAYFQTADPFEKLAWERITEMRRTSPMTQKLGMLLGMTDTQIDDLFVFAASIAA